MKHLFKWAASVFVAMSLAACGGGGGSAGATSGSNGQTSPLATTAPSAVTIPVGGAQTFTVSGGSGPYTAVSDNASIAVGSVEGGSLTIGAVAQGDATISIFDAKNSKLTVTVHSHVTALSTTAPSGITLANGETSVTFTINNGQAPYNVVSTNQSIATVSRPTATTFKVTGGNAGTASVVVSDSIGESVTVSITVTAPPGLATTAPSALSLSVGNTVSYTISGGSAPYNVQSSNPNVATATQSGSQFTIRAISIGTANIVVRDSLNDVVTIAVAVAEQPITLNPSKAKTIIGTTNYSYIRGGVPPYTAVSSFAGAATVDIGTLDATGTIFTPNPSGNVLRMVPNTAADPNQIVVTDTLGNQGSFALTSGSGSDTFTFAPETLTVSACSASPFTLSVLGATGTLRVFSSDTSQFTASLSGTTVTVTPVATPIVPGTYVFTVVDQNGANALATVLVPAPGAACP